VEREGLRSAFHLPSVNTCYIEESMATESLFVPGKVQVAEPPRLTPRRLQILWGYLFIAPWILGFLMFFLGPMAASLYLSMTDYNIEQGGDIHFIGLQQYKNMFSVDLDWVQDGEKPAYRQADYQTAFNIGHLYFGAKDYRFWKSIRVTLLYACLLPFSLTLALILAILTNNQHVPGVTVFRTLFYLPTVIPLVVSSFVFQQILRAKEGWLNLYLLAPLGIRGPQWLQDPDWAIFALGIIGIWGVGRPMLMFLAGLQNVPTELYEAARVDGAGPWRRLTHITLPMISPIILYNLVIGLIDTFQYFVVAYVLTNGRGGNDFSMYFYNLHIYKNAYTYFDMGYASALAWVLMIIVITITALIFRSSSRWVFYSAGAKS
jgi:multiple sugar transport system permease protein